MQGSDGRTAPRSLLGIALAALLASCSLGPDYQSPTFPFARSYPGQGQGAPVLLSNAEWWKRFKDPTLDALIARAIAGNLDLASAKERVLQAKAELRSVAGPASLNSSAQIRETAANGSDFQQVGSADLNFSWLFDPFGARRAQLRSSGAQVEVADAEVSAAQLLVLYNLTNAYVDLRYNQRLLVIRQQDLANRRKTLDLTERFFAADSATRLDIVRSEAVVADIEGQIPAISAAIAAKKGEIAVLTGVAPGQLSVALNGGSGQPRPRLSPQVGIPTDLLRNRPDIRIAERLYYAAVADVGVARAGLYPKLSLGGALSLTAIGRATNKEYYFGPSVQFPIPVGPAPRAAVEARESRARQAHIAWKSAVLSGMNEVETSLVSYSATVSAVKSAEKTVKLYNEVVDLTRDLIDSDGATLSELIDAETSIASANGTLAGNLRELARSFIQLNISLGSGNSSLEKPG